MRRQPVLLVVEISKPLVLVDVGELLIAWVPLLCPDVLFSRVPPAVVFQEILLGAALLVVMRVLVGRVVLGAGVRQEVVALSQCGPGPRAWVMLLLLARLSGFLLSVECMIPLWSPLRRVL